MNSKLQNIFVSLEAAKMAQEKGFDEWCAGNYFPNHSQNKVIPNINKYSEFCESYESYDSCIPAPTHYQLIKWLLDNHQIDVWYGFSEWSVYRSGDQSAIGYAESINEALLLALNQLPNKP